MMELDFDKICRICLKDGIMMSIFKVNISKKMMSCASVQVWQNDGLPAQICNKCSAKLHISFQFKKQCEKSDAKLRQILLSMPSREELEQEQIQQQQEIQHMQNAQDTKPVDNVDVDPLDIQQQLAQPNNCVYIECAPILEQLSQDQNGFISSQSVQPPLSQINYNIQHQNHIQLSGYNIQGVGQVQVYNGTYTMPMQPNMQNANVMHNQVIPQIQIQQQSQMTTLQPIIQQSVPILNSEDKDDKKVKISKRELKPNEVGKQCPTCNKVFGTATKLTRHMKTHSTDMPYKCKVCNKAFSHSGNYKIHLRMHTDERPFRCTVCDKGCRQAQDLEKHMRTHTGFNGSSTLIVHRRSHTGERPYICSICTKGFAQSSCLAVHMKRHNSEKNFNCTKCDSNFITNSELREHVLSHVVDKQYTCNVCNKKCNRLVDFNKHLKTHGNMQES
ncbi:hypothetical protein NQ317_002771 [Molorchus minor]|uniref:Uncharacterized protein n=1 Tax=Molorchus minor TaxID=1323400 RepID=A0ABQ9JK66_9CUCU|nr:hypothetical protein NQ317_002771 [Molorchus minor]